MRTGTAEARAAGRDTPDFVLGDASLFVGVDGEVRRARGALADLARSTERNDQIGRYLARSGVVLPCNVRGFGLLTCDRTFVRGSATPMPPARLVLEKTVDLWAGPVNGGPVTDGATALAGLWTVGRVGLRTVTTTASVAAPGWGRPMADAQRAELDRLAAGRAHDRNLSRG